MKNDTVDYFGEKKPILAFHPNVGFPRKPAILILRYFNLSTSLISMVMEREQKVVQRHLDIIAKYFPDSSSVEDYLTKQEIIKK